MSSNKPLYLWDITIKADESSVNDLKEIFKEYTKKWVFQLEKAESGYLHYQCRISLKDKMRNLRKLFGKDSTAHWSPTHTDTFDYVMKADTRQDGPWSDQDETIFIPPDLRDIKLNELQQKCFDMLNNQKSRKILFWEDTDGNVGKTVFTQWMMCYHKAIYIPPICTTPQQTGGFYYDSVCRSLERERFVIFDIPRSVSYTAFRELMTVIELVKDGYAFDGRNKARMLLCTKPKVLVCYNVIPHNKPLTHFLSFTKIEMI